METIRVIINGLCVAIPTIMANIMTNRKTTAIMEFKIQELTKKVELHNNLIDRMYKVESRVAIIEDEIKDRK